MARRAEVSYDKVDYRAEFIKLRFVLESQELAKIWVYFGRETFSSGNCTCPDAQAYVVTYKIPEIRICIEDENNETYKNAVLNLLHEYGHIIDEKTYKKTKRFKISEKYYPQGSFITIVDKPKYAKSAVAKTEYMAYYFAKQAAKKFNILIKEDDINLEQTAAYQSHYTKLVIGRRLNEDPDEWKYFVGYFKKTGIRVTCKNVDRLDNLLPNDYY